MKIDDLVNKACDFARNDLVSCAKSKIVQFVIGASTVGVGKDMIKSKISPFVKLFEDENGDIDVCGLKESVMSGFSASGSIPFLCGMFALDCDDAKKFFDSLEAKAQTDVVEAKQAYTEKTVTN
jgi:hypothetical protein